MPHSYPILEYDDSKTAVIEPSKIHPNGIAPRKCVICFFREAIRERFEQGKLKVIYNLASEIDKNPLYEFEHKGERIGLFHPGVGAPLAGGFMDEVIALGSTQFIAVGSCGVLDSSLVHSHLIIPTSAVRDEGTSYHYLPPSREVEPSMIAVNAIKKVLTEKNYSYTIGKTWTTDAIFRETHERVKRRRAEGCITVEMESSAFFAVAKFRGVEVGQILYASDDVSGEEWDAREGIKNAEIRKHLIEIAADVLLEMG